MKIVSMLLIIVSVALFTGCARVNVTPEQQAEIPEQIEPLEQIDTPEPIKIEKNENLTVRRATFDFSEYPKPKQFIRGINLGNALEAPIEGSWGMFIREEFFSLIKEAGFDHVRIPIRWSAHASKYPPYAIWPGFLNRVDEVIDQALRQGLTVVINIHHYEELMHDPQNQKARFLAIWRQIAESYKDWPDNLWFSILNEPMGNLTADLWNEYLVYALEAIRETNPYRTVVIGPANWNAVTHLAFLNLPDDENLMATFHYYSPFDFTHQGAGWVNNPPPVGTEWEGTNADVLAIQRDLDRAVRFAEENNVTVWLGEFGAYSTADMESRVRWTSTVAREAEKRGIPWSYWEFGSGFGVYDRTTNSWRESLLKALIPNGITIIEDYKLPTETKIIYDFDVDAEGWIGGEAQPQWSEGKTTTATETDVYFEGQGSLKVNMGGGANRYKIMAPANIFNEVRPGKTFIFRIYLPENSGISAVQPYVQFNNWSGWLDNYIPDAPEGVWIPIEWTIPEGVTGELNSFGIMFHTEHNEKTHAYVDSILMKE